MRGFAVHLGKADTLCRILSDMLGGIHHPELKVQQECCNEFVQLLITFVQKHAENPTFQKWADRTFFGIVSASVEKTVNSAKDTPYHVLVEWLRKEGEVLKRSYCAFLKALPSGSKAYFTSKFEKVPLVSNKGFKELLAKNNGILSSPFQDLNGRFDLNNRFKNRPPPHCACDSGKKDICSLTFMLEHGGQCRITCMKYYEIFEGYIQRFQGLTISVLDLLHADTVKAELGAARELLANIDKSLAEEFDRNGFGYNVFVGERGDDLYNAIVEQEEMLREQYKTLTTGSQMPRMSNLLVSQKVRGRYERRQQLAPY